MDNKYNSDSEHIAIVCVGYNRVHSMSRLLNSLAAAQYPKHQIPLIISIDKSDCIELYSLVENFEWLYGPKNIIIQPERLGLKKHIFACGDLSEKYKGVIILEDDLIVGPTFYNYVEQVIEKYGGNPNIAEIALYKHSFNGFIGLPFENYQNGADVYLMQSVTTWGQCFTRQMWKGFVEWLDNIKDEDILITDMPDRIKNWKKAWSKYLYSYVINTNKFVVYPNISLTTNFSDAGVHGGDNNSVVQEILQQGEFQYRLPEFDKLTKYDVYYNNLDIANWLNLPIKDITLDIYGYHRLCQNKKYLLTSIKYSYPIEKEFGLLLHPIELNIKYNISGQSLKLYKTDNLKDSYKSQSYNIELINYFLCKYGIRHLLQEIKFQIGKKINRLFHLR